MIIELTKAVSVRTPDNSFVQVPAGTKVNYASHRNGDHMVHTFWHLYKGHSIEHVTVTEAKDRPDWM